MKSIIAEEARKRGHHNILPIFNESLRKRTLIRLQRFLRNLATGGRMPNRVDLSVPLIHDVPRNIEHRKLVGVVSVGVRSRYAEAKCVSS